MSKQHKKNTLLDEAVEWGVVLAGAYLVSRYIQIALSRGNSMEPTIKHNRIVLIDCRKSTKAKIKRQDIIAFRPHVKGQYAKFLKRVIGVSGDLVEIKPEGVFVNQVLLNEPYVASNRIISKTQVFLVPANCLFVLGDNRDHSLDSRSTKIGFVNYSDVVGVAKNAK